MPARPPQSGRSQTVSDEHPTRVLSPAQVLLEELLRRSVVLREEWENLTAGTRDRLRQHDDRDRLTEALVGHHLLTPYQANRIHNGQLGGLILGNYRILDHLGAGGMGIVYKAEHLLMRRLAAIKVLPNPFDDHFHPLQRFLAEVRVVANLHHPNIVAALDAGKTLASDLDAPNWHYLVMEYVPGPNLEQHVLTGGPLSVAKACELICQVASALAEAHKHQIIHRDIKPSNILLTPDGQAKLTDFGLVRPMQDRRLTKPGTVLGTIDYIAPEQSKDASSIDERADIFALGGTLYWCLTGKTPYPPQATLADDLVQRQTKSPPPVRNWRPELPVELEAAVARMLALNPDDRIPTAQGVIHALLPYLRPGSSAQLVLPGAPAADAFGAGDAGLPRLHQVLIADDDFHGRALTREVLEQEGLRCDEVENGRLALQALQEKSYDLVLLDCDMPEMTGPEVLRALRENPPYPNVKVIMFSGQINPDEMAEFLSGGADDYLPKPPSVPQLVARVKAALALKDAQDQGDFLRRQMLALNAELECSLRANASDLVQSRNALILTMAELAETRADQEGGHLLRLQRYCRCLAGEAAQVPAFAGQIDAHFLGMLECCAPLHDIGQLALPDHILRKAGRYDHEERLLMQTHTTLGADILQRIAQRHMSALAFLQMATAIARHHHEAYDGAGYPDRLAGTAIPLAARIVTIADVYDALRCPRPHRPPFSHLLAVELMTQGMPGKFDPHLLAVFQAAADRFEQIFKDTPAKG